MGQQARCTVRLGKRSSAGEALLESQELVFRGDFRLRIPFQAMTSVRAEGDQLRVEGPEGLAVFELGPVAARWAQKILKPPSRLDKLGVKPGMRVAVVRVEDGEFLDELRARKAAVGEGLPRAAVDLVFLGARTQTDLEGLARAKPRLKPAGALWVVWRKGRRELNEDHVRAAARRQGLVDVKVVAFSVVLSALKLVILVADR